jgi:hypothetical protein
MNRLTKSFLVGATCAVLFVVAWFALVPERRAPSSAPAFAESPKPASAEAITEAAAPVGDVPAEQLPESSAHEPTIENDAEVAATSRMYIAHAPLREPTVADPDSEANRRILETMVLKALHRATQPTSEAAAAPAATP